MRHTAFFFGTGLAVFLAFGASESEASELLACDDQKGLMSINHDREWGEGKCV